MKFKAFKELKVMGDVAMLSKYLMNEMAATLRDLNLGLSNLTFGENFSSFEAIVTLAAGEEIELRNALRKYIPRHKIILRADGEGVVDGDAEWTLDFVSLKNVGASTVTATILFLR